MWWAVEPQRSSPGLHVLLMGAHKALAEWATSPSPEAPTDLLEILRTKLSQQDGYGGKASSQYD